MLGRPYAIAVVALAIAVTTVVATKVRVVEQWALYTSNGSNQTPRLFLEPFPLKKYCQYDAGQVVHNGGSAECRRRISFTLDTRPSDQLLWTFINEWGELCGSVANFRISSRVAPR